MTVPGLSLELVLASQSPRRAALLDGAGLTFRVVPADVPEDVVPGKTPSAHVARLARAKADAVAAQWPRAVVLGADTVVVLGDRILGKPGSEAEAGQMMRLLSGQTHAVLTGVCLHRLEPALVACWVCRTAVTFRELNAAVITRYCALVNTLDKAGGYAIQEYGDMLVARISGRRSNVIGLPVEEVLTALQQFRSPAA